MTTFSSQGVKEVRPCLIPSLSPPPPPPPPYLSLIIIIFFINSPSPLHIISGSHAPCSLSPHTNSFQPPLIPFHSSPLPNLLPSSFLADWNYTLPITPSNQLYMIVFYIYEWETGNFGHRVFDVFVNRNRIAVQQDLIGKAGKTDRVVPFIYWYQANMTESFLELKLVVCF